MGPALSEGDRHRRDTTENLKSGGEFLSRSRRAYPSQKVCGLALVADWTYILRFGSIENAFAEMVYVVNEANRIYEGALFGDELGVSLHIVGPVDFFPDKDTSPWINATAEDVTPYSEHLSVFQAFGATNGYDNVCLGHLFLHTNMAPDTVVSH